MLTTTNPALNDNTFRNAVRTSSDDLMTVQGTINKTTVLFLLALGGAIFSWNQALTNPASISIWAMGGGIAAFVMALITVFKKEWSPATAPAYALIKGTALGAISVMFEQLYGGIVFQAVLLTFGTMFGMLMAYNSGLIKVTERFRSILTTAIFAIGGVYLISMLLGFFGISIPFIFGSGMFGIGFSLLVIGVAAFSLVLDFDLIKQGEAYGAPKYMEWYGGFGLMVTMVWLYLEILRLLAKLQRRD